MKAIYDSNFKRLMERPDQVIILTGYSLVPKEGEEKFSKEIYTVSNKNILEVYINTSELDGYTIKETAEGFEKDSDRKEVNSIKLFYKLEGEVYPETLPYVLIKFDGPTRLDSGNNLLKIKFPETFKAKIKGLGFNRDINFLEGVGSDKVMNILYLDSINDITTEYSVSKDSYYKYLLKRENTNLSDFSWKDEEGKFQTENYTYRVYDESTFEVGVSDMMSLNKISTKLHLFVDKDGVVKVRGVVRYTEYQVSNGGDPVEICSGLADVTGIDGVEIKLDETENNFRYSIVNSLSNISYYAYKGTISNEMKISEYPYGIFHMELTYRDRDGYKTIKSNKFRLIQSGMVEIFSVFKNTEYSEGNIPVYLLERYINNSHDFYATLMTDFSVSDLKSNTFFIFEGDNLENGEIIGGEYKEYMESIFKITPTISTVEEGLLKISVVLSTKTTNNKPYWLPHPVDKSIPIKVTMRIQANDGQYDYSFYIIQKADVDDIEAHNDNGPKKSEFWIPEEGGTIDIAVSLEEDIYSEGEKDINSLYWRILEAKVPRYIITNKEYVPVLDHNGNPVYFTEDSEIIPGDIHFPELSNVGKLNKKIPDASLNWPEDFERFHVSYPHENQITDDRVVAVYKLSLLNKDSYPNGDEEISLTDWKFVASSSVIEITIKQHKQAPYVKIYTSKDKSTEITDSYTVYEVNSYPMYIESNLPELKFTFEGDKNYINTWIKNNQDKNYYTKELANLIEEDDKIMNSLVNFYNMNYTTSKGFLTGSLKSDDSIKEYLYFNVCFLVDEDFTEYNKLGNIKIFNKKDNSELASINIIESNDWSSRSNIVIPEMYGEVQLTRLNNGLDVCNFVDFSKRLVVEKGILIYSKPLSHINLLRKGYFGTYIIKSPRYATVSYSNKLNYSVDSLYQSANFIQLIKPVFSKNTEGIPVYKYHKFTVSYKDNFAQPTHYPISMGPNNRIGLFLYSGSNHKSENNDYLTNKFIIPLISEEDYELHSGQYSTEDFSYKDGNRDGYHYYGYSSDSENWYRLRSGPRMKDFNLPKSGNGYRRLNLAYFNEGEFYTLDYKTRKTKLVYSDYASSGKLTIGPDYLTNKLVSSFTYNDSTINVFQDTWKDFIDIDSTLGKNTIVNFSTRKNKNCDKNGGAFDGHSSHDSWFVQWYFDGSWKNIDIGFSNAHYLKKGHRYLYWLRYLSDNGDGTTNVAKYIASDAKILSNNELFKINDTGIVNQFLIGTVEIDLGKVNLSKKFEGNIYIYPYIDIIGTSERARGIYESSFDGDGLGNYPSIEGGAQTVNSFLKTLSQRDKDMLYYYSYGQFHKLLLRFSNSRKVGYYLKNPEEGNTVYEASIEIQYNTVELNTTEGDKWNSYTRLIVKSEDNTRKYVWINQGLSNWIMPYLDLKLDSVGETQAKITYYAYGRLKNLPANLLDSELNSYIKPIIYKFEYDLQDGDIKSLPMSIKIKGYRYHLKYKDDTLDHNLNLVGDLTDKDSSRYYRIEREIDFDTREFNFEAIKYDNSAGQNLEISVEPMYIPHSIDDIITSYSHYEKLYGEDWENKLKEQYSYLPESMVNLLIIAGKISPKTYWKAAFPVNNTASSITREYKLSITSLNSESTDDYTATNTSVILSITQKPYKEVFEVILPEGVKADEYNPLYFQVDGSCNMLEGNNSFRIKSNNNNLEEDLKVTDSLGILNRFIIKKTNEDIENNLYYYTVTLFYNNWVGSHDYSKSIEYLSISIGNSEKKRLFYKQEYIHLAVKKANSHRTYDNDENLEEELIYYHTMKYGYYDKTQSKFVEGTIDISSELILNGKYTPNGDIKKVYSKWELPDGNGNITYEFKNYKTEDYGTINDVDFKLISRKDDTDYDPPALQDEAVKNSSAGEDTQVEYSVETSIIFGLSSITEFLGNSPMIQWMKNNLQEDPEFSFKINYKIILK